MTVLFSPSPAPNDLFGYSVSIDGDYAVVGAYGVNESAGAAFIFHRTGSNDWDTGTRLYPHNPEAGAGFGKSVSISGDYAIVGAHREDSNGEDAGAAYIYHRTDVNTWDAGTKLLDGVVDSYFGAAVAISGDYAIVGVPRAYYSRVYHRIGENQWDGGAFLDSGGSSVAIEGDYAVVGNVGAEDALVFRRTGLNMWDTGTGISAFDEQVGDSFGSSVSISGDRIAVGADNKPSTEAFAGAVYLFTKNLAEAWDHEAKVVSSLPFENGFFGQSVGLSNDTLVVGSSHSENAVHLFRRNPDATWSIVMRLASPVTEGIDSFGNSVAIDGSYVMIGDYTQDTFGTNTGAVYILVIN
ncbi:MAG TPA: FG-GAP repeat protein [Verrucomicrobiota bacterium]|nr:FG-GAP repeat protein [Verrucomicrobiota bacterium]